MFLQSANHFYMGSVCSLFFFPLIRVVVDFRPGKFSSEEIIGDYFSTLIAVAKIYHHL